MNQTIGLLLILVCILCGAVSQLFLKLGMNSIGKIQFINKAVILHVFTNPHVLVGMVLYVISALTWLVVLSRLEVNYAYPLLSLSLIIVAVASWAFLGEGLPAVRIVGICLIIGGAFFIVRS